MKRLFSMLDKEGRPVAETCLCEDQLTDENQQMVRNRLSQDVLRSVDAVAGWVDVTAEERMKCAISGDTGAETQAGRYLVRLLATMPRLPDRWQELPQYAEQLGTWKDESQEHVFNEVARLEAVVGLAIAAYEQAPEEVRKHLQGLAIFVLRA